MIVNLSDQTANSKECEQAETAVFQYGKADEGDCGNCQDKQDQFCWRVDLDLVEILSPDILPDQRVYMGEINPARIHNTQDDYFAHDIIIDIVAAKLSPAEKQLRKFWCLAFHKFGNTTR